MGGIKNMVPMTLRKTYNRRISIALVVTVVIISVIFIGSVIADKLSAKDNAKEMKVKDLSLEAIKPNEPPPPPPIATIAFTPPKVVKDEEVIKPPPEVKQIEEAKVDVKTVEGTKDLGVVAPPVEDKGTQVVAAPVEKKEDEDKIFTKVEIEAKFDGDWSAYVRKAIEANADEFTESDYGTVHVRFIVDKTGRVSDVEALDMKNTKLAEVAINAIRKCPPWIPAIQNGSKVNAYRIQPVTLVNPN